ncbi:MAG: galactose mutarotase, partial [Bacteroidota bacterium]
MSAPGISKTGFGTHEGQEIEQYSLSNDQGMTVKVITYGATITSIAIPGADIVCGFDSLEGYFSDAYLNNAPYFGCT